MAVSFSAQASYPTKAVEFVIAIAPGGGADVAARVMTKYLSADLGVPFNIVNKPGGNQIPGVLYVMRAAPDGYTLMLEWQATGSLQSVLKDLPYKIEERTFISVLVAGPPAIVVNGKSPWNSLKDVVEAAKKDPASFTWARSGGATSVSDLSLMLFLDAAGVPLSKTKAIPFAGSGPAIRGVAGGHVMLAATGAAAALPLMSSGDLKALAVTGDKRLSIMPNVPSASEAGFPQVSIVAWYGFSGPKGLAKQVTDRLAGSAKKMVEDPQFVKDMEKAGRNIKYMAPEQTREYVLKEAEFFKAFYAKHPEFR